MKNSEAMMAAEDKHMKILGPYALKFSPMDFRAGWQAACEWRDSQVGEPVGTVKEKQNDRFYVEFTKILETGQKLYAGPLPNGQTPFAYATANEVWLANALDINEWIKGTGIPLYTTPPAAQINQQLVEALDKLHAVVIAKNRAGADWGEQFTDLMVALSLAQSALNAAKSGDV